MNVSDLLDLDVIASLDDDGGLLLDAPKGALTPELIERIRHSKALLIAEIVGGRDVDELGQPHRATAPPSGDGGDTPTDTAPSTRPTDWLLTPTGKEPLDRTPVEHADAPAAESNMITAELLAEVRKGTHRNRHFELYAHALKRGCSTCRHRKTPGLSWPGHCAGGRDDLAPAYGASHPLRRLPDDQGIGCASHLSHEDWHHAGGRSS